MLSTTNTIADIKTELEKPYTYYGYASDNLFSAQLTLRVTDAEILDLKPLLGESYYDQIAAKDKVALTFYETYIYKAEIFYACARFLKSYSLKNSQSNSGGYESIMTEGYQRVITGGGGATGYESLADYYSKEARACLAMAGFKDSMQLKRGNSTFSGFNENDVNTTLGMI